MVTFHEIRIHGRGGQGVQTVGHLIAHAYFARGKHVQTFATYGGERRGAPVTAFVRVSDAPIQRRCDVERPNVALLLDSTFLDDGSGLVGLDADAVLILNTAQPWANFAGRGPYKLATLDALKIARDRGLGRIVNTAMLGALARVVDHLPLELMADVVRQHIPHRPDENLAALRDAYSYVNLAGEVAAGG